jgi:hypothetical protein
VPELIPVDGGTFTPELPPDIPGFAGWDVEGEMLVWATAWPDIEAAATTIAKPNVFIFPNLSLL